MQAHDVGRARDASGDGVDVEVGGVGGEHRAGFADAVELGKDRLLDAHLLEHRLDHQVHGRK